MSTRPQTTCRHHWVIDAPNGPISQGHCKTCGAAREFRNSFGEFTYWKGRVKKRPGRG